MVHPYLCATQAARKCTPSTSKRHNSSLIDLECRLLHRHTPLEYQHHRANFRRAVARSFRWPRSRHLSSPNHLRADRLGIKKYSPPRSTLNVSIPCTSRLTGYLGIVKFAPSSCRPMIGSRSPPIPMKLPSLIYSCCRNSMVSIALALMNRK